MNAVHLSRDQARQIDRRAIEIYGLAGIVLMENAGRGVADHITRADSPGEVAIFCGKGNNGGDGFVIARHLHLRGWPVRVVICADDDAFAGDAAANLKILRRTSVTIARMADDADVMDWEATLENAKTVVDALLGTGASGDPRRPYDAAIRAINRSDCRVVAVDVPSGLDCDTGGAGNPTVRADETVTFVAAKLGFRHPAAAELLGVLRVVDIGTPPELLRDVLAAG